MDDNQMSYMWTKGLENDIGATFYLQQASGCNQPV